MQILCQYLQIIILEHKVNLLTSIDISLNLFSCFTNLQDFAWFEDTDKSSQDSRWWSSLWPKCIFMMLGGKTFAMMMVILMDFTAGGHIWNIANSGFLTSTAHIRIIFMRRTPLMWDYWWIFQLSQCTPELLTWNSLSKKCKAMHLSALETHFPTTQRWLALWQEVGYYRSYCQLL